MSELAEHTDEYVEDCDCRHCAVEFRNRYKMAREFTAGVIDSRENPYLKPCPFCRREIMSFDEWWERTGSGIVKHESADPEEHARMVAKIAWHAAMREAVAEWEKPHGLTDGRRFIDRMRGMAECDSGDIT